MIEDKIENQIIVIKGKVQTLDIMAVCCNIVMLVLFLWIHIVHQLDMLFVIILLIILEIYFAFVCLIPYEYVFSEKGLEIRHRFCRMQLIQYTSVYHYEAYAKDGFLNITENNEVKVYYQEKQKYRLVKCNPNNVEMFVWALKRNCILLHEEKKVTSKLEKLLNR